MDDEPSFLFLSNLLGFWKIRTPSPEQGCYGAIWMRHQDTDSCTLHSSWTRHDSWELPSSLLSLTVTMRWWVLACHVKEVGRWEKGEKIYLKRWAICNNMNRPWGQTEKDKWAMISQVESWKTKQNQNQICKYRGQTGGFRGRWAKRVKGVQVTNFQLQNKSALGM